jgi:rhodanese-related sulfurtransferase
MFGKVEKEISVDELKKINKKHTLIIDVRDREEFEQVHIPNAINVPRKDLVKQPEQYIQGTAYLICQNGNASGRAVKRLQKNYDVVNVKGGITAYGRNYGLIRTTKIQTEKSKK